MHWALNFSFHVLLKKMLSCFGYIPKGIFNRDCSLLANKGALIFLVFLTSVKHKKNIKTNKYNI